MKSSSANAFERNGVNAVLVKAAAHVSRTLGTEVVNGGLARFKASGENHLADRLLGVVGHVAVACVDLVQIREQL